MRDFLEGHSAAAARSPKLVCPPLWTHLHLLILPRKCSPLPHFRSSRETKLAIPAYATSPGGASRSRRSKAPSRRCFLCSFSEKVGRGRPRVAATQGSLVADCPLSSRNKSCDTVACVGMPPLHSKASDPCSLAVPAASARGAPHPAPPQEPMTPSLTKRRIPPPWFLVTRG